MGYVRPKNAEAHTVTPGSVLAEGQRTRRTDAGALRRRTEGLSRRGSAERLAQGRDARQLLPEAFAACREAARRTKNMRHFDVQILGGVVLHRGNIAEMVTGEGKTLVATLPAYLNALEGKGVHVVTVNDYLARRDCEWMLPIYNALGITAGYIQSDMDPDARRKAYDCDITYGTNSEFGFDYLRDNMKPARWGDDELRPVLPAGAAEASTTPSSTRWTTSSSTRPARRSSSPARRSRRDATTGRRDRRQLTELERRPARSIARRAEDCRSTLAKKTAEAARASTSRSRRRSTPAT